MTEELFRSDSYLKSCEAVVTAVSAGGIELNRTVFYPEGGGQPGDRGSLKLEDGRSVAISDTVKGSAAGSILHLPAEAAPALEAGSKVMATIDWERRYRHMQMHSCLHLLCALVVGDVTGGQIGAEKSRLDFNLPDGPPDKAQLQEDLNRLVQEDHPVAARWIEETEIEANPQLIRTMSVKPPSGSGRVRLLDIEGVDLQPCGGTHVRSTAEIGRVEVGKIENKGKQNRRINLRLPD